MKKRLITQQEFINELRATVERLNSLLQNFQNDEPERFMSVTETARLLTKSRVTVYKLIRSGELKAFHTENGRMRIRWSDAISIYKEVQFKYQSDNQNSDSHGN